MGHPRSPDANDGHGLTEPYTFGDFERRKVLTGVGVNSVCDVGRIYVEQWLNVRAGRNPVISNAYDDVASAGVRHGDDVFNHFAPILCRLRTECRFEVDCCGFSFDRIQIDLRQGTHGSTSGRLLHARCARPPSLELKTTIRPCRSRGGQTLRGRLGLFLQGSQFRRRLNMLHAGQDLHLSSLKS